MDIHHEMIIHNTPGRVYQALTSLLDFAVWMGAQEVERSDDGSMLEFRYAEGSRTLKLEVTRLDAGKQVQWRVVQPAWPMQNGAPDQLITWTLSPYEINTLVDFRMQGWPEDSGVSASVSYKWASFMLRLKVYLGDTRDIDTFLPVKAA